MIEARRPDLILVDKKVKSCVTEADLEEDARGAGREGGKKDIWR